GPSLTLRVGMEVPRLRFGLGWRSLAHASGWDVFPARERIRESANRIPQRTGSRSPYTMRKSLPGARAVHQRHIFPTPRPENNDRYQSRERTLRPAARGTGFDPRQRSAHERSLRAAAHELLRNLPSRIG